MLGIPPAFNLSQDQTLQLIFRIYINANPNYLCKFPLRNSLFDLTILSKKLRDFIYGHLSLYLKYIAAKCPQKLSIKFLNYSKFYFRHFVRKGAILSPFQFLLQAFFRLILLISIRSTHHPCPQLRGRRIIAFLNPFASVFFNSFKSIQTNSLYNQFPSQSFS